jgi:hypothetical protein
MAGTLREDFNYPPHSTPLPIRGATLLDRINRLESQRKPKARKQDRWCRVCRTHYPNTTKTECCGEALD